MDKSRRTFLPDRGETLLFVQHVFSESQHRALAFASFTEDVYSGGPVRRGGKDYFNDFGSNAPSIKIIFLLPCLGGVVSGSGRSTHI
jgi:hypothetical protein